LGFLATTFLKLTIDCLDVYVVVGQGHEGVVDQVSGFSGDLVGGIVFAGHHHFRRLFADFFEDLVVAARQEFAGVGVGVGVVAAIADYPKHLGEGVRRGSGLAAVELVEATAFSGVAGNVAELFDGDQEGITVTVIADGLDLLGVARGFALVPEGGARSTPKPGLATVQGFLQGLRVHPGHHQDGAVEVVLDNSRDEVGFVEFDLVDRQGERGHGMMVVAVF
jgi:hypothetical protein